MQIQERKALISHIFKLVPNDGFVNKLKHAQVFTVTNQQMSFDILLTVHLSTFILVINQPDAQNFCFTISLFHASTCFQHTCSKHVEAWNKLIVKQKFCASSWLITEIKTNERLILYLILSNKHSMLGDQGGTVVKVLCYKSEGRWFDPSRCHWNFSLT